MPAPKIQSFVKVVPMIYAYNTPGVSYHDGWTKIGYTEKQEVKQRINQQTHTADIRWVLAWQDNAMYKDGSGEYFTDRAFHDYLQAVKKVERERGTEWFRIDKQTSLAFFTAFAAREKEEVAGGCEYELREEQARAVQMTKDYFAAGGKEFLWNAKPRFGKTLSAYDLVQQMGCKNVLIFTNRPRVANSWAEYYFKFIAGRGQYAFVSENAAVKDKKGVLSREQYCDEVIRAAEGEERYMIAFESLQSLKGSVYFGGRYDKLKWLTNREDPNFEFDLLIVDEAHEGVKTAKTERAFLNIPRKHTLYLSGTPFKELAGA